MTQSCRLFNEGEDLCQVNLKPGIGLLCVFLSHGGFGVKAPFKSAHQALIDIFGKALFGRS